LWFEKLQGSVRGAIPERRSLAGNNAVPCAGGQAAAAAQISACMRSATVEMEGADTPMLVLMRLIRSAVPVLVVALALAAVLAAGGTAFASDYGQPTPWQMGFQKSAAPTMDDIAWFHDFLLWVITIITLFVLALLLIVIVKFNAKANPTPSRTTHNTLLEVAWTVIPVVILVVIAVPSFRILFFQLNTPPADVTIKATGKQWYWSYGYPDSKFEFDSIMLKDNERKPEQPRLLAVDNEMVVPVNKVIRVQVIGADVIHAFAVPSFGVKIDAIPGRLNETWFKATREGVYYGQCSELCGKDHAFMPIAVRVVNEQAYTAWIEDAKKKYARDDRAPATNVAAAAGAKAE
jgi:cytochrome c oxidase subunit 2